MTRSSAKCGVNIGFESPPKIGFHAQASKDIPLINGNEAVGKLPDSLVLHVEGPQCRVDIDSITGLQLTVRQKPREEDENLGINIQVQAVVAFTHDLWAGRSQCLQASHPAKKNFLSYIPTTFRVFQ